MTLAEWEGYERGSNAVQLNEATRERLAELEHKLAVAQAEIRRCQTRLFAYERAMLALRRENAELEAKCAKARALGASLNELFSDRPQRPAASARRKRPIAFSGAQIESSAPIHTRAKQPETDLERVACELIDQFDVWLEQNKR